MTIEITSAIIAAIAPQQRFGAAQLAAALTVACNEWEIDTPARVAAFLAQIAHESDGFRTAREYASGTAYEGRRDLGNTEPGDGPRFKGRGFIQITGRANYAEAGRELGLDLIGHPDLLEEIDNAASASAWWWWKRGLNALADADDEAAMTAITKRINGGLSGWDSRLKLWRRARNVLGA